MFIKLKSCWTGWNKIVLVSAKVLTAITLISLKNGLEIKPKKVDPLGQFS